MKNQIDQFISKYNSLKYNEDKTKIICQWTKHEMPLNIDRINEYINGNKYKKLLQINSKVDQTEIDKYKDFLIPSNKQNRENQLFCKLTFKHLNKQTDHIHKHVNGKRFQKAFEHWNWCQENGKKYHPPGREPIEIENDEDNHEDDFDSDDMNEHIETESVDSLSDLYPKELLGLNNNKNNEENDEDASDDAMSCDDDDDDKEEKQHFKQKRKLNSVISKNKKNQPKKKISKMQIE